MPYANSSPVSECSRAAEHSAYSGTPAQAVRLFPRASTSGFSPESRITAPRQPAELTNRLLPLPRIKCGIFSLRHSLSTVRSCFSSAVFTSRSQAPPIFMEV